ncbi:MAG TPA: Sua5/YciO/YrdC/YwlC family protein [Candidatus Obscuribacterales bacterium]
MIEPNLKITRKDLTDSGAIFTSAMQHIKNCLSLGGFVLLPSDTGYSVAALAKDKEVRRTINTLLERKLTDPISLCFANLAMVEEFICLNSVSASLLETFTPGPITVVCNVKENLPKELTSEVAGSDDRTIGVRIPDSFIERNVASWFTKYTMTTVAVRDPLDNNKIVKDFEQAIKIVKKGMENENLRNIMWGAAVEGKEFYANQSTVVHVTGDAEKLKLVREGDISFEKIQSALGITPFWAIEEWT